MQLAHGLLQANPNDAGAQFIIAAAAGQKGDNRTARRFAARAYRNSDDPKSRLRAAQFAARAAMQGKRPTLTQLWLRRAATNTKDPRDVKNISDDYARVRAINPFSFNIRGSVAPSNNVNSGADTSLQIIDGVPVVGYLSGSAQALSGVTATADVSLRYRIARSETGATTVGTRVYHRRVWLSSEAKALAPDVDNGDLWSTYADVSVDRFFRLGAKGNTATLGASLGRSWSGGKENYDFAKLRAGRQLKLSASTRLSFSLSLEERRSARMDATGTRRLASQDQTLAQIGAHLTHKLGSGDTLGLSFSVADVDAGHDNTRTSSTSLRASYSFGKPLGPADVTASLTLGQNDYPDFRVGFIEVPGGRQDHSVYADVTFFFSDYDYAGFAPSLRVRAGQRSSNVSRYESNEISVGLEIRSKF